MAAYGGYRSMAGGRGTIEWQHATGQIFVEHRDGSGGKVVTPPSLGQHSGAIKDLGLTDNQGRQL